MRRLAQEQGELPTALVESGTTHQETQTLAEKLRELTELREAGLITLEEFEAKKQELLDKM